MTSRLFLMAAFVLAVLPGLSAQAQSDEGGHMQRKATEASADRLLDDSLLSNPERRARAAAKLAEPEPDGQDPATQAEIYYQRGNAATELGRQLEALKNYRKASHLVAPNGNLRADIFYNLAQAEGNLGRIAPSIASYREAIKSTDSTNLVVRNLALIAEGYAKLGNADGARQTRDECRIASGRAATERSERNLNAATWRQVNELRCDIAVSVAEGKLAEAEPKIRRVIANYEDAPNTRGTYIVGNRHAQLAENLRQQGRLAEAENEARIALNIFQSTVGVTSQRTGFGLVSLGRIIAEQGRLKEGEALARKGLDVTQAAGVAGKGGSRGVLADILASQYRWAEARTEFDTMREAYAEDPEGLEAFITQNSNYALAMLKTGGAEEALRLFSRTWESFAKRLGDEHYDTAQARGFMAASLAALGRDGEAKEHFAKAIPRLVEGRDDEDEETGNQARDQKLRLILEADMALLLKSGGAEAIAESFRLADAARGRSVQRALAASAVRAAAADPALAQLARHAQDAEKQISALNGMLANAISARAEDLDSDAISSLKKRIKDLRSDRADGLRRMAAKFPEYARMLNAPPTTVADVQARLRSDEAMLAFYSADDRLYVWAVPASGETRMAATPLGRVALEAQVKALRRALDLSISGIDEIPDFDLDSAWKLYAASIAPTEPAWAKATTLFTVPHGPLGQLPLALLPTASPPKVGGKAGGPLFAKYRDVPWLARKVAIAQLPSAGALTTLRALPERKTPRRAFIAFGDPLFAKDQMDEAPPAAATQRGVKRRSAPKPGPDFTAELAQLPRLPDTAEEVSSIARVLGADPERDIFLQTRASEARVRSLDLSQWRIVMFATHGLIPGDLVGLDQPALALTSPEVSGDGSAGVLTMERIMGLKLDADWVVLSACNTAAGEGAGAEAVSGLGRAFFYAGTRALLVSNWPVETTSARMLTTDLFRRQAGDPALTRAQALRQAMLALMDGPGPLDGAGKEQFSYAHPTFWAPFSLVGDGGGGG
ncbi:hypothetical protein CCC_00712 [Paramagnetospirillum magnetotacticum MS-1]|uniref:CHAT domain-containing protein n=1 Tax=Paramagnetospirillum magnetotacticum MS-1 TaxID=272627 RepID=A0A0C2UXW7_PARME|nr:CHAT domain-containing protein [Paramagnetospirillum magnetotacticum]KIL97651.1 hypothetical protein CCC_00712 [Paramagnetospirillum magnetotacticum MS-1]